MSETVANPRIDVAVVDDTHFYRFGAKLAHAGEMDLADLLNHAEAIHAKNVWIVAGTWLSGVCSLPIELDGWNITATYSSATKKDHYSYISARRTTARHEDHIEIGFPEFSRWPWAGSDRSAKGLLATILRLEDELGIPVAWTPAHTALELFKRLNANRYDWLQPVTLDLESKGFSYAEDVAVELHWPPKGQEIALPSGATHIIRLDTNSAYNAAETGLNVGAGNPEWCETGALYDGKRPGIWRVEVAPRYEALTVWNGKYLPDLAKRQWMTTDMIEQVRRCGYNVDIVRGWVWKEYHQTLRSYAELLWDLRVSWRKKKDAGAVNASVYESISVMLKALHGRLARPDNAPRFRRRDIWALVVSRSVAMTIYKIEKIHREYGLLPVGIKADELKYAVNDPHVFDGLVDRDKLGGLKLVEIEKI